VVLAEAAEAERVHKVELGLEIVEEMVELELATTSLEQVFSTQVEAVEELTLLVELVVLV
jgi:hypothetical protein